MEPVKIANKVSQKIMYFETASGHKIDLSNPKTSDIEFDDIALALSRIVRFSGQTRAAQQGYSVAAHSVWISVYLEQRYSDCALALYGLLHDAHEAYTGDISLPLKSVAGMQAVLAPIEKRLQKAIHQKLKLLQPTQKFYRCIKHADQQALRIEAFYLKESSGLDWDLPAGDFIASKIQFHPCLEPLDAQELFIRRYYYLVERLQAKTH